ncbi:LOW QUALITY PROTEIN: Protein CBG15626 [Caenorhabditis briggsae]|uniref:Skp1-related protein n=1 Tax=Caenorhabditis briggsae TaxID=6238 RepID=A8XME8_CAEBR|nr:LOW QUALITY PROTEIN: Protein CBG15626 [Caenorhabditis briggsae]CAP33823.1 Protein CBG15626 [Caenorhabditis briggsae]
MADQQAGPAPAAAQPAQAPTLPAPKPEPSFYFFLESFDKETVKISDLAVPQLVTINNLVSGLGYDAEKAAKNVMPIDNITGVTLKRVVAWSSSWRGVPGGEERRLPTPDQHSRVGHELFEGVGGQGAGGVDAAANYLESKQLLRYCCKKIAIMAQGKTPEELRVLFEIPTDEEDAIAEQELKERLEREAKEEAERQLVEGPSTSDGKR